MNFYQFPLRIKPFRACHFSSEDTNNNLLNIHHDRLIYVHEGEGEFIVNGQEIEFSPNHIYIFQRGRELSISRHNSYSMSVLQMKAIILYRLNLFDFIHLKESYKVKSPVDYQYIFNMLVDTQKKEEMCSLNRIGLASILLSPIEINKPIHELHELRKSLHRFEPVLEYIDKNFHKNIKVSFLAELIQLSETYFATSFSKAMGTSPLSYINQRRIEEVKYLLVEKNDTLEKIASFVGYKDASHLTKVFKDQMDMTPGKYRRHYQIHRF